MVTANHLAAVPLNVKSLKDDGTFEGYGSVFGVKDSYDDIVMPGAFKKSLALHKKNGTTPALLWQHDPSQPIGNYTTMKEDSKGLWVQGKLLTRQDVPKADEAYSLLKAGAINGLSIGFNTIERSYNSETDERSLITIDLWECSVVTFPANGAARISDVKSFLKNLTLRQFERQLEENFGFSDNDATTIALKGFKAWHDQREADSGAKGDQGEPDSAEVKALMAELDTMLEQAKNLKK